MKILLIGAGSIAHEHLKAIRACGAEVVGVASLTIESSDIFAKEYKVPAAGNQIKDMVEWTQPDAVYVLTQPYHYQTVLEQLKPYNLPTLIEKPFGVSVEHAQTLTKLLPTVSFAALNRRFYSNIQAVMPLLEEQPPFMVQVAMPEREKDYGQYENPLIRNTWPMSQGIHLVDLVTHLAGPLETILGMDRWGELPKIEGFARYNNAMYQTSRGHRVNFMSNFDSPGGWRIHCFMPKQEIMIAPIEKTLIKTMSGVEEVPIADVDKTAKPGFIRQTECFLKGVVNPSSLPADWVSPEDAIASMRVLEHLFGAYEATETDFFNPAATSNLQGTLSTAAVL